MKEEEVKLRVCIKCNKKFAPMEPDDQIEERCAPCQAEYRSEQASWSSYVAQLQAESV